MIVIKRKVEEFFIFDEEKLKEEYIYNFDDEESMKNIPTNTEEWEKWLLDTSDPEDYYDNICNKRILMNDDYDIIKKESELQWLKKILKN